ncbi:unnamed protein product [Oncorhynchus mykiss]|uniref:Uncharacterized protein n=1 Tax=Oncorhynchus mykiss TaxID=8022 RepID=A0A060W439_ONCMY|nr:unnamed protein product [Oncorhynchus mykiss]
MLWIILRLLPVCSLCLCISKLCGLDLLLSVFLPPLLLMLKYGVCLQEEKNIHSRSSQSLRILLQSSGQSCKAVVNPSHLPDASEKRKRTRTSLPANSVGGRRTVSRRRRTRCSLQSMRLTRLCHSIPKARAPLLR